MTTERIGMLVTIVTVVTQTGLYLLSGGFSAGGKLTKIESEMRMIRQELKAANQMQDYRINKLEEQTPTK
ncbi:hypothetical protein H6G74_00920 [Nostoc spongiaeforme FACHB-130]|uniref:Uncharacterized protein n=1 Tax=Nostoc spongiaeforme FACHB-130 TaxID=1357510 RepID=A0ABR8FRQ6_9NOSO|nr:hypothetical protein [Nostoc spongiaeforme]MBD2592888.1 hypothetical protein [Nostoc spongiaeforme FACHB-130]